MGLGGREISDQERVKCHSSLVSYNDHGATCIGKLGDVIIIVLPN